METHLVSGGQVLEGEGGRLKLMSHCQQLLQRWRSTMLHLKNGIYVRAQWQWTKTKRDFTDAFHT